MRRPTLPTSLNQSSRLLVTNTICFSVRPSLGSPKPVFAPDERKPELKGMCNLSMFPGLGDDGVSHSVLHVHNTRLGACQRSMHTRKTQEVMWMDFNSPAVHTPA
jgi:hypothetical protein